MMVESFFANRLFVGLWEFVGKLIFLGWSKMPLSVPRLRQADAM
jgi:hypothetical protein